MNFATSILSPNSENYSYKNASNMRMAILGCFFFSDVGTDSNNPFREWALVSVYGDTASGNCTFLEIFLRDNTKYVLPSDQFSEDLVPTKLKMTVKQFIQLCDDWQEKVVKRKPKEVIIKHALGEFLIETSD